MNYTETLKNYLQSHQGELFDVGYEHETRFGMMDKKTMTRIIGRLSEEDMLMQIVKGVFYINGLDEFTEDKIVCYYCSGMMGMKVGSSLFSYLEIKSKDTEETEIITNKVESNKKIGNYRIYRVDIPLYDDGFVDVITLLEIFEKLREPYNNVRLMKVVQKCISNYSDKVFEAIIKCTDYKLSTVLKLQNVFKAAGKENKMFEIFEKCGSDE